MPENERGHLPKEFSEPMVVPCNNSKCPARLRVKISDRAALIRCPLCSTTFRIQKSPSFVIFDLETTGLSPENCEIIQIAAVRLRNGSAVADESFFSYCRPHGRISSFISSYTGITDWHVKDAPRPIEALTAFSRFVGDSVIMAHNGHRFDIKFLEATCTADRVTTRPVEAIDTIAFSRKLFGTVRGTGHGLDRVLQRLGLNPNKYQRHDARGDIEALSDAVSIMWRRLRLDADCSSIPRRNTVLPANR